MRDLLPTIVARQIRLIPLAAESTSKYICMRLELYGCSYQDGPIAYSMPQGDKRGLDDTYDGHRVNGTLHDGLGQLTDGIVAEDGDSPSGLSYDWIGWRRRVSRTAIALSFHFASRRNFTSIRFHTSNLFTHDIYLFHSVVIAPCQEAIDQRTTVIIGPDRRRTDARWIQVSLANGHGLVAQCLIALLTFDRQSKWILIGEVHFEFESITNETRPIVQYGYWLICTACVAVILCFLAYYRLFQVEVIYRTIPRMSPLTVSTSHQTHATDLSLNGTLNDASNMVCWRRSFLPAESDLDWCLDHRFLRFLSIV